jgi:hypothetical protein
MPPRKSLTDQGSSSGTSGSAVRASANELPSSTFRRSRFVGSMKMKCRSSPSLRARARSQEAYLQPPLGPSSPSRRDLDHSISLSNACAGVTSRARTSPVAGILSSPRICATLSSPARLPPKAHPRFLAEGLQSAHIGSLCSMDSFVHTALVCSRAPRSARLQRRALEQQLT